jgi:hypothetical protein
MLEGSFPTDTTELVAETAHCSSPLESVSESLPQRAERHTPRQTEINVIEVTNASNDQEVRTKETAPSSSTDSSVRGTTSTSDRLTKDKVMDHSKKTSHFSGEQTNEINILEGFVVATSPL